MEYKVSERIQKKFDTLTKDAKVQKALQFMEDDQNEIIDRQIELTLIPAPTYHEQKKYWRRKDGSCRGSYGHSISA